MGVDRDADGGSRPAAGLDGGMQLGAIDSDFVKGRRPAVVELLLTFPGTVIEPARFEAALNGARRLLRHQQHSQLLRLPANCIRPRHNSCGWVGGCQACWPTRDCSPCRACGLLTPWCAAPLTISSAEETAKRWNLA